MKRKITSVILTSVLMISVALTGCNADAAGEEAEQASGGQDEGAAENETGTGNDAYDDYIKNAIASVDGETQNRLENEPAEESAKPFEGKTVQMDRSAPNNLYVSATEGPEGDNDPLPVIPTRTPTPDLSSSTDGEVSPSPTEDPDASPTPTPTPYITPEEFDVDTCCIYINGESDSAFGTEVVTAINKIREDLGYKPFISNKGLATCADRRTRELAASYSHTRPNGLPFYSVAPEHFKAEMLVVGTQKAEDAVDTLIKTDPVSRGLIFTNKYKSIGASSFKCNGRQCTVVAFGL